MEEWDQAKHIDYFVGVVVIVVLSVHVQGDLGLGLAPEVGLELLLPLDPELVGYMEPVTGVVSGSW